MVIRAERVKELLQGVSARSLNPWTVWTSVNSAAAVQLFNDDGSNVYVCKTGIPEIMLATLTNMNVRTEFFEVLWVSAQAPDPDAAWYLSLDNGVTLDRVNFITRESRVKATYWSIILRNG